jgi:hypothetical protein
MVSGSLPIPILLQIEALQLVTNAGPDEEGVLMQFIGSVHAQSELTKRRLPATAFKDVGSPSAKASLTID